MLIRKKHRLWQRYIETGDQMKYKEYAKIRNRVKKVFRKAKIKTEKGIAKQAKQNPKVFWRYVNSKRKIQSKVGDLE